MTRPLNAVLYTPLPKLAGELAEVLRLFYAPLTLRVVCVPGEETDDPQALPGVGAAHACAKGDKSPEGAAEGEKSPEGAAEGDKSPEGAKGPEEIALSLARENGVWRCRYTWNGETRTETAPVPDVAGEHGPLLYKRLRKRLCKLTLYHFCRERTGLRPPWGSLTGIRPTRLLHEGIARGETPDEAKARLINIFDVSPQKAELLARIVERQRALPLPREGDADVYVSIPFCRTRCAYCSFPGAAVGDGRRVGPYLLALTRELQATRRLMDKRGLRLRCLYVGGGTPTALDEAQLDLLLDELSRLFPGPMEFTVEAGRPDTLTRRKLESIRAHGAGRISVNPQTMVDRTLRAIGRDHTAAQTVEAFAMAREAGLADINMDVIAGLPGEDVSDFAHTMEEISSLAPDSLTVHTLAIKRTSRLDLEHAPLPDGDTAARMVALGGQTAAALGMGPYYLYRQKYMAGQQQNVGYAKPGLECLYNVDIMEEIGSILACGAGAISKRVFADRELRIERAPNVSDIDSYLSREPEMERRKEELFQ